MEKLTCKCSYDEGVLTAVLDGSIDNHTVKPVREEIDHAIYTNRVKNVVLDFSGVGFMDSSGLGLILGRYAKITDIGGRLTLRGLSDDTMKIITLAGVDKLIPVEGSTVRVKKSGGND